MNFNLMCAVIIIAAVTLYAIVWRYLPERLTGPKLSEFDQIVKGE